MASEQIIHFLNRPEDLVLVLRIQEDSCDMKSPIINQIPGTKMYFLKHCELSLKEIRAPMNTLQCIVGHDELGSTERITSGHLLSFSVTDRRTLV